MTQGWWSWRSGAGLLLLMLWGCEGTEPPPVDVPFTPAGTTGAPSVEGPSGVRGVLLLFPPVPDDRFGLWDQSAHRAAGLEKVFLTVARPSLADGPDFQVRRLAEVADQGLGAVILVPPPGEPSAELEQAVKKVVDRGTKVVFMERSLPVAGLEPAPPAVVFPPVEETAEQLVAAALAEGAERPEWQGAKGPALILYKVDAQGDWHKQRLEAIRSALRKAGIEKVEEMPVESSDPNAKAAIIKMMERESVPKIVIACEGWSLVAAGAQRRKLEKPERVVLAGFSDDNNRELVDYGGCDALVECNLVALAQRAVRDAAALLAGRPAPATGVVETPVVRTARTPIRVLEEQPIKPPPR